MLKTVVLLRTETPGRKAQLVADMIHEYGIDIETLDGALAAKKSGKPAPEHAFDPIVRQLEERFKPAMTYIERMQQREQEEQRSMESEAQSAWETFAADPQYPHAETVKDDMASLLSMYAERRQPLSLQDAYKMATMRQQLSSGQEPGAAVQPNAAQLTQAARRAAQASVSLAGSSAAPLREDESEGDGSLRSDLMSSISRLSNARR
jgi:hypothetical protein